MKNVSAVLLGAGESKRMGVNKLGLPWGEKTVLEHCLRTLLRSRVNEVIVVLSDRTQGMRSKLARPRVKVVMNPRYRRGMSTSIQKGVRALGPGTEGILIALGDQPLLKSRTVNALVDAFRRQKGRIIVPSFEGRRGHPVLFDKCYRKELLALEKDVGGRSILQRHPTEVYEIRTKSPGVLMDLDTWQDYRKGLRKRERRVRMDRMIGARIKP